VTRSGRPAKEAYLDSSCQEKSEVSARTASSSTTEFIASLLTERVEIVSVSRSCPEKRLAGLRPITVGAPVYRLGDEAAKAVFTTCLVEAWAVQLDVRKRPLQRDRRV
jgi:hypothetical protein